MLAMTLVVTKNSSRLMLDSLVVRPSSSAVAEAEFDGVDG
jgi:hypothetical protein